MKFRKKPVVIDAMPFNPADTEGMSALARWLEPLSLHHLDEDAELVEIDGRGRYEFVYGGSQTIYWT